MRHHYIYNYKQSRKLTSVISSKAVDTVKSRTRYGIVVVRLRRAQPNEGVMAAAPTCVYQTCEINNNVEGRASLSFLASVGLF